MRGTQCRVLVTANNPFHIPYNTDHKYTHIQSFFPVRYNLTDNDSGLLTYWATRTVRIQVSWLRTTEVLSHADNSCTRELVVSVVGCVRTVAIHCSRCNIQRSCTAIEELQKLIRTTVHLSVLYSHRFTSQTIGVHTDPSALRLSEDRYWYRVRYEDMSGMVSGH